VPSLLSARPPQDPAEERAVGKLAASRHAPGDWIARARMITRSWDGARTSQIAAELHCHPQTVRERIKRFNAEGWTGLVTAPVPAASPGSPSTSAAGSSPWSPSHRRGGCAARPTGAGTPTSPRRRPTGPWTPPPRPPRRSGSRSSAARSAASWGPRGPLAPVALLGPVQRPGVRRKPTAIVALSTHPPARATVVCADELGPVTPPTFPPAPAWTADGHRVKAPLDYSRGIEKTWIYGGLRVADGQAVTCTAASRNSVNDQRFLELVEAANPAGDILVITDNLSSHTSVATRTWLADHPRIRQVFIPKGACWLNLQEAWWRLFRRQALAGQCFADAAEITPATRVATCQLNQHARPWVWGRTPPSPRHRRRVFMYHL